jgi:hypothetical protein
VKDHRMKVICEEDLNPQRLYSQADKACQQQKRQQ